VEGRTFSTVEILQWRAECGSKRVDRIDIGKVAGTGRTSIL
jgi:hypothetical protein